MNCSHWIFIDRFTAVRSHQNIAPIVLIKSEFALAVLSQPVALWVVGSCTPLGRQITCLMNPHHPVHARLVDRAKPPIHGGPQHPGVRVGCAHAWAGLDALLAQCQHTAGPTPAHCRVWPAPPSICISLWAPSNVLWAVSSYLELLSYISSPSGLRFDCSWARWIPFVILDLVLNLLWTEA